ncbi:hemerythrin domain-containing protein [Thermocatellispora tengchongensis]|uniref:hemerythrin domain-containing protein n=1 Tax=Thermocatellispora tengchongensis TaxID=1073253 RepID=UPI003638833F
MAARGAGRAARLLDAGRTGRSRDLRAHCLAFCAALTRHHTGEDETAFPLLAERHPGLRPVLEELRRDHDIVTGILRAIEDLLAGLGSNPAPEEVRRVRGELDGLSALLDSHFLYEEKRIVQALNELDPPGWREGRPAFLRPGY